MVRRMNPVEGSADADVAEQHDLVDTLNVAARTAARANVDRSDPRWERLRGHVDASAPDVDLDDHVDLVYLATQPKGQR